MIDVFEQKEAKNPYHTKYYVTRFFFQILWDILWSLYTLSKRKIVSNIHLVDN